MNILWVNSLALLLSWGSIVEVAQESQEVQFSKL